LVTEKGKRIRNRNITGLLETAFTRDSQGPQRRVGALATVMGVTSRSAQQPRTLAGVPKCAG